MKICNYNIEWMNALFKDNKPDFSDDWSARYNITKTQQLNAIAEVIRIVDADVYIILEAPNEHEKGSTSRALENFAKHFGLRQSQALIGAPSTTDQEIACLYDPKKVLVNYRPHKGPKPPKFTDTYELDDPKLEGKYVFSKPPLELDVYERESEINYTLIGAHFKSKATHGAKNDDDARKKSLLNRKKQIAQAFWLRERIDQITDPLIVCGDFNDGPGHDQYECVLGSSSLDILTKDNALYDPAMEANPPLYSARFYNRQDKTYANALIDFSFASPQIRPNVTSWEIWHPTQNKRLEKFPKWLDALLTASDHYPVCIEIK